MFLTFALWLIFFLNLWKFLLDAKRRQREDQLWTFFSEFLKYQSSSSSSHRERRHRHRHRRRYSRSEEDEENDDPHHRGFPSSDPQRNFDPLDTSSTSSERRPLTRRSQRSSTPPIAADPQRGTWQAADLGSPAVRAAMDPQSGLSSGNSLSHSLSHYEDLNTVLRSMLTVPLTSVLPVSFEDLSSLPQNNAADEQVQTDIRNEYQQRQRTNPFVERRMRRRNLQSNEWPLS